MKLAAAYVYLASTLMLFINNTPHDVSASVDRALKGSSLFGMFLDRLKASQRIRL
ncbi:hypothetical protein MTR_3g032405 [Medicago truncatula]|uniref:Uncharacterized protein n=1 Tax=Medicago truncatula TaxID=3880 RepID=A0A072UUD2_MEDTR|nr:hypothetical protein MTR_3g032405 [Medicago truncatula]